MAQMVSMVHQVMQATRETSGLLVPRETAEQRVLQVPMVRQASFVGHQVFRARKATRVTGVTRVLPVSLARLASVAMKVLLVQWAPMEPQARKACKAHRVPKAPLEILDRSDPRVTRETLDLAAPTEVLAMWARGVTRETKAKSVTRAPRDPRECRAILAPSVLKAAWASLAPRDTMAIKVTWAESASWALMAVVARRGLLETREMWVLLAHLVSVDPLVMLVSEALPGSWGLAVLRA